MLTLIEQEEAKRAKDAACEKWARAEDAWEAITWAIARDPSLGEAVTESGKTRLLKYVGARSIKMPSVTVIYEVAEPFIIVHSAEFAEAEYGQAGNA
jgi:hypothetical protein